VAGAQALPADEREAIGRYLRELDRLGEDLAVLDREIAERALDDSAVKRLMTVTAVMGASARGCSRRATSALRDSSRAPAPSRPLARSNSGEKGRIVERAGRLPATRWESDRLGGPIRNGGRPRR
jgi:hypothetical protein